MRKQWLFLVGLVATLAVPHGAWARLPAGQALQFVPHVVSVEAGVIKPGGIAVADLDGDGDNDIVVAGAGGLRVYRNDGKNNFSPKTIDATPLEHVKIMSIGGDERADLVVSSSEHTLFWFENHGDLVFSRTDFASDSEAEATAGDVAQAPLTQLMRQDWDGDGDEDVLTIAEGEVYWLENVGEEQFTRHALLADLERIGGVVIKDIDGDGDDDIVAADTVRGALYWYEQAVAGVLSSLPSPSPTPISVLNNNQPPVADAGVEQTVSPDAVVTLDGRKSSDPDNDALTYHWRQLAGPTTELLSDRTAQPTFTANSADEAYVFMLTVKDSHGASAVDTVTVATQGRIAMLLAARSPHEADQQQTDTLIVLLEQWLPWASAGWLVLALLPTLWLAVQRWQSGRREHGVAHASTLGGEGRVLHYQTGQPIAGAQVFVYDRDNKLRATERTNEQGAWPTLFPAGEYSLKIAADGFEMAASASAPARPSGAGMLYAGGVFTVPESSGPLTIVIPVRPLVSETRAMRRFMSHSLQALTQIAHVVAWPVIGVGAVFSTGLLFWRPSILGFSIEGLYIGLLVLRTLVGRATRPAYGVVRDHITRAGVDLAVVRLFTTDTNRLVMTRVTNSQGRFFALPPAGLYTVTVTKPGYTTFTKEKVVMGELGAPSLNVDLMPLVPVV